MKFWTKRGKRGNKVESSKDVEPNYLERIVQLQEEIFARESNNKQREANLLGQISELQERLAASKIERKQLEATLRGCITELEENLEEIDREREQVESTLRGKMEEMDRKRKETEEILCLKIYKLSTEHEERVCWEFIIEHIRYINRGIRDGLLM